MTARRSPRLKGNRSGRRTTRILLFAVVLSGFVALPPASAAEQLASPYVAAPRAIDGGLGHLEWTGPSLGFPEGFVRAANDRFRLYLLIDVLADDHEDAPEAPPGDGVWVSVDVDGDGAITPGVDLNYRTEPETWNLRHQTYTGAGQWDELTDGPILSSLAPGFGCFLADGTLSITLQPAQSSCQGHRVYELALDLAEIGADAGEIVRLGIRVTSESPSFTRLIPADFTDDFSDLIEVTLGAPPTEMQPPHPESVVGLAAEGFETTQAIQFTDNSLPLVKGKPTAVRVYTTLVTPNNAPQPARVYLYGDSGGDDLSGSPLAVLFTAPPTADRERLSDTANFRLPASWVGRDVLRLKARVVDFNGNDSLSSSDTKQMTPIEVPVVWTLPLNSGGEDEPSLPSDTNMTAAEAETEAMFPVPSIDFVRRPWTALDVIEPCFCQSPIIDAINDYYWYVVLSWMNTVQMGNPPPFTLPRLIHGIYDHDGEQATSDGTWFGGYGIASFSPEAWRSDMAHEMDHNLQRVDPGEETWGEHIADDPAWPYPDDTIQTVGFDARQPWVDVDPGVITFDRTVWPAATTELMEGGSGGVPKWISPYRWLALMDVFQADETSEGGPPGIDELVSRVGSLLPRTPILPNPSAVLWVTGSVDARGGGRLDPVFVQPGTPTEDGSSGSYAVEGLDRTGRIVSRRSFEPAFSHPHGNRLVAPFRFRLESAFRVAAVRLVRGNTVLDEITASANVPSVRVTTPTSPGSDGRIRVRWTAQDADGDSLLAIVLYSPDGGASWFPAAGRTASSSVEIDAASIPGGARSKVRVIVTDGFNTTSSDSPQTFSVAPTPPVVRIMSPPSGSARSCEPIELAGKATDAFGSRLSGISLIWSIGRDHVATGESFITELPAGINEVTLTAIDGRGQVSISSGVAIKGCQQELVH